MLKRFTLIVFLLVGSLSATDLSTMDSFRSKVLTSAVSLYFQARGYGTVENATVDTTKKTLNFILAPEGETQKLFITIGSYMTFTIDNKEYLVLQKVQTNRVWLNRIFAYHMKEGIKIPLGTMSKGVGSLILNI
jgi:hypothetical protein